MSSTRQNSSNIWKIFGIFGVVAIVLAGFMNVVSAPLSAGESDNQKETILWSPSEDLDSKIDPFLDRAMKETPSGEISVIIEMKEQQKAPFIVQEAKSLAIKSQKPLVASLEKMWAKDIKQHWIINAVSAKVPAQKINEIATRSNVKKVWLDKEVRLADSTDESATHFGNGFTYFEDPVTASLSEVVSSNTASWTTGGPYGGYINSLVIATTNPDVIYAGTESGLFKTIAGGVIWTRTGFPEMRARFVQVAPDNSNIIYAGTDDGIYKSEDGGSSWAQKGLLGARVNAIAIDPINPHILYAGTGWPNRYWDGEIVGIFKSVDGGETWQLKLSSGLDAVAALLIDTEDSSYIYAGVYTRSSGPGLRKSTNGGETWVRRQVGPYNWDEVVALAMTPAGFDPPVIYAVGAGKEDVYKSQDRGESWTPTNTPNIPWNPPWALAVDPNNPNVIYVGTWDSQGTLYKSTDGSNTWSIKANGLPPRVPSSIVIDPRDSAVLYVSFSAGGVYKSTDRAESWNISSQGMNNTIIEGLAVHPTSSDTVFTAIKGDYLAKTTNGGTSWDYLVGSPSNLGAVTIDPQNPSTIFVGSSVRSGRSVYIYKSTDGGLSWRTKSLISWADWALRGVSDIWIHPFDSSIILAAVAGFGVDGGGVYRSTNGGATWQRTYSFWATTLAADPTNPNIIYFGTARNGYVFRSTDGGISWARISPGGEWVWEVRDIEVDLNSQVYAATDSGLKRWNGSGWTNLTGLPTDDVTALAIDRSTIPGIVYVGTGGEEYLFRKMEETPGYLITKVWGILTLTNSP